MVNINVSKVFIIQMDKGKKKKECKKKKKSK